MQITVNGQKVTPGEALNHLLANPPSVEQLRPPLPHELRPALPIEISRSPSGAFLVRLNLLPFADTRSTF